jgi:D-alanyl-D-alanine carboxypeptidase/D-alanyl-D-alanine-endopeptidase (penicillin-binding protein 4)
MLRIRNGLTVAIATATSLATISPAFAQQVNSTAVAPNYFQGQDSIPLFVPPPENNAPNMGSCAAALDPAIKSIIGQHASRWGILVEPLDSRVPLYSHNADRYFIPASNVKIFTTAAALQRLSPQTQIQSRPLETWVRVVNIRSHNASAETLLRSIGGAGVAKSLIAQLGVDPSSFRLADGSGLSRNNVSTPRALVETLRAMHYAPGGQVFHASLPIAGVSGTLSNRMRATPAQGVVFAKTGTLSGVRTLSGYINHPEYGVLVFSILANNPSLSGNALVRAIDSMVVRFSTVRSCS